MKLLILTLLVSFQAQARIPMFHRATEADLDARKQCFQMAGEIQSKVNCQNLNLELRNEMILFSNGVAPINDPCSEASARSSLEKLSNQQIYINSVKFSCMTTFNTVNLSESDREIVKSYPNRRFLMWAGAVVFGLAVFSILTYLMTLFFKGVAWIFRK